MNATQFLPPVVRALATAMLVVSASVAAEASGAFWGALVASLPVSAGPAYVFLALQHDAAFVAASALGSCAANAATGMFLIVYAIAVRRAPGWLGLCGAVLTWLACSVAVLNRTWTPLEAVCLNLVVYAAGVLLLQTRLSADPAVGLPTFTRPAQRLDLVLRAGAVALFVSCVVAASAALGAAATGVMAVFPVSLISLNVLVQSRSGRDAAARLSAHALRSMFGFGLMLLALHLAIGPWGIEVAFVAALLVSVLWSGVLLWVRD